MGHSGHSAEEEQEQGLIPILYFFTFHPLRKHRPVKTADKGFLAAEVILLPLYNDIN